MKIAIIDYGAGNTRSVQFALDRLNCPSILTNDKDLLLSADGIVFPGVGHAENAMKSLQEKDLVDFIPTLKQPVLGICLGMQLMCKSTEEGNISGLGIFDANVQKFNSGVRVPQIGWNKGVRSEGRLFRGVPDNSYFYFVHSYYAPVNQSTSLITEYGIPFSAAMEKDNFFGCQFHPEKSSATGEIVLKNFIELCD
ncbi:MAG: imidazole glycerol phosphate synthase subunit HisH [Crocinitomicaceae bacterium]|nr:imidazole glycerol phosphate synthase subunit HisH [Crocinitomicaceae bacterium]